MYAESAGRPFVYRRLQNGSVRFLGETIRINGGTLGWPPGNAEIGIRQ